MTDLGTRYPPSFTGHPPHMSVEDYLIWQRLWPTLRETTIALYFDVGLGQGRTAPPDTPANYAAMWTRLNQKRADVIYQTADAITILELRDNAQSNAVGRLMLYAMLWRESPPIDAPLRLMLATNTHDADVAALCDAYDITYLVL